MGWFSDVGALGHAPFAMILGPGNIDSGIFGVRAGSHGTPIAYGGGVLILANGTALEGIEATIVTRVSPQNEGPPGIPSNNSSAPNFYLLESRPDEHTVRYWQISKSQTVDQLKSSNQELSLSVPTAGKPTVRQVADSTFGQLVDWGHKMGFHGSNQSDNITFNDLGAFIHGWRGSDTITGGNGEDDIWEGARAGDRNVIDGKGGVDGMNYSLVWEYKSNETGIVINGGVEGTLNGDEITGIESVTTTEKADNVYVGTGDTRIDEYWDTFLDTDAGNDTILGNGQDNQIKAGADDDLVYLSKGTDRIEGEGGDDVFKHWAAGPAMGIGDITYIDGGANTADGKDVLELLGARSDYAIQADADGRTVFTHKTDKDRVEAVDVEFVTFEGPFENTVSLTGGSLALEAAKQSQEVYTPDGLAANRRGWHDVTAIELGLKPSGSWNGGFYSFQNGHYHQRNDSPLGINDTDVLVQAGVVNGDTTLWITFKGSDPPTPSGDLEDWVHDVTDVGPFYTKHKPLVDALKFYLAEKGDQLDQIVVAGHSLGAAMTQHLINDLSGDFSGSVSGYTFGNIGGELHTTNGAAATGMVNFMHVGDIADYLPESNRAGPKVYLESPTVQARFAGLTIDSILSYLGDAALSVVNQHYMSGYRPDMTYLVNAAKDSQSLFHDTQLAQSLREGWQWNGEAGELMSGRTDVIRIFAGAAYADNYDIDPLDDFVLGGGGDDRFTLLDAGKSLKRHIDGGAGSNDLIVLDGDEADFQRLDLGGGVIALQKLVGTHWSTFAEIKNVEKIAYTDRLDRLLGKEKELLLVPNARIAETDTGRAAGAVQAAAAQPNYTLKTGYDYAVAGDGMANITGTSSDDVLYVGRGNKTIAMGGGNDIVIVKPAAGTGPLREKITIDGGKGADIMHGGRGAETFVVDNAGDIVHDDGGKDIVRASVDYHLQNGIETLVLTGKAEIGAGNSGANSISGNRFANTLVGIEGKDTLAGGGGNDTLIGGMGRDRLTGGAQADIFVFNVTPKKANTDTITDFKHDTDIIALDDAIFAAIGPSLSRAEFYAAAGASRAHDRNDRIVYDTRSGKLYYDDDGNKSGGHAPVHFATLSNKPVLDHGDFAIV